MITGVYTVFGGLHAVMYTEAIQAVVLLAGSAVLMFYHLSEKASERARKRGSERDRERERERARAWVCEKGRKSINLC
jgi:Na+(H+)/acetate symporter ActP